ncbi:NitT/TauT family transport system ATP-binding protein [Desulfohalotomaculum tongense]|uniref:ABC transporter ATP-binding protein n=1 Tax=Desulforadius tongensis TaxID=1216062 RepID=UPI0019575683|nr:ABC transporter ATP-binding protein [Desulforadius tongensis]MBM7855956.1 NitT/TauT family transport system ATP-binding protein [Desulforadius tongensis]
MIVLKKVNKSLGGIKVLQNLSFTVERGKITCILGPSGCGKTTTLQMLAGLEKPDSGTIEGLSGVQISYAFQEPRLLPWKTVEDNLHFVLKGPIPMPERQKVIDRYLKLMGLSAYKNYYPRALSGGMKQRLSLCRAFAFPHQLLLMDEPFKSLDAPLRLTMIKEVTKMWDINKNTIVFITHDVPEALLLGHKLLVYSAKPASVQKELTIDIPHGQRDLGSKKLAAMYGQLISLLEKEY